MGKDEMTAEEVVDSVEDDLEDEPRPSSPETEADAAAAAGRDPDEITICVAAPAYVGDDLPHQRDQVRWFGGMVGNHVADLGPERVQERFDVGSARRGRDLLGRDQM